METFVKSKELTPFTLPIHTRLNWGPSPDLSKIAF